MKKIVQYFMLSMLLVGLMIPVLSNKAEASELNFAVQTVIPDNQVDKSRTYFDLRMTPGQKQDLEVILRNDTEKDVIVIPSVNSAFTNLNGVVEYGTTEQEMDSTLLHNMKDIVKVDEEITVPAKGETTLIFHVEMPEEAFKGLLAGGITFSEKPKEEDEADEEGAGLAIKNEYAYVIGLVLSESDEKVAPELVLNDVFADQVNARNVIKSNLQNIEPVYVNELLVSTKITKKGSSDILFATTREGMQMAPNSNFDFPTALEGERLQAGEYTIDIEASSGEYSWHFTKDFTITADEAKKFNDLDVSIVTDNTWIYIVAGIAGGVLFMLAIFLLLSRRKKSR